MNLINGFLLGLSLILAIGAQNAFVFRVGLEGRHVFAVCLLCALSDAALIVVGISGMGSLLAGMDGAIFWLYLGASVWLIGYGLLRLRDSIRGNASLKGSDNARGSIGALLVMAAGLTWLNPHVYLDTVVLLGGISATLDPAERPLFGLGAAVASFVFFFTLGYGAQAMGGRLANPGTWKRIDFGIAMVMFWLAGGLIWAAFSA